MSRAKGITAQRCVPEPQPLPLWLLTWGGWLWSRSSVAAQRPLKAQFGLEGERGDEEEELHGDRGHVQPRVVAIHPRGEVTLEQLVAAPEAEHAQRQLNGPYERHHFALDDLKLLGQVDGQLEP